MSAIVVAGFLSSNILAASSPATADASGATVSGLVQSQFGSNTAQNLVAVPVELEYKVDQLNQFAWFADVQSTEAGYTFSGLQPGTYRVFIAHGLKQPGRPEQLDFAPSKFNHDANGVAYTSDPVYRYFRVGAQTNSLSVNLLAKTKQDVGTASGLLKDVDGGALFDDSNASVPSTVEFLDTSGNIIDSAQSDSNGNFTITLVAGDYYARVGCKDDSTVQCHYFGGSATLAGASVIHIEANADLNAIDITSSNLKQFSVTNPVTTYDRRRVYLGQTVKAFIDPNLTEHANVTYQWYTVNMFQLMFGDPATLIPGATSDSFTVTDTFDSGGINGAIIQSATVFAEVTYSLDGYATVKSTFSGRNLSNPFANPGVKANAYEQPYLVKQPKVLLLKKPKVSAKLIYPVLSESELNFGEVGIGSNWFLCSNTKFKVDLDFVGFYSDVSAISGGGCKAIPESYQLSEDTVALPKGYKGKYLVAVYWMQNTFDGWVGSTKPVKLK